MRAARVTRAGDFSRYTFVSLHSLRAAVASFANASVLRVRRRDVTLGRDGQNARPVTSSGSRREVVRRKQPSVQFVLRTHHSVAEVTPAAPPHHAAAAPTLLAVTIALLFAGSSSQRAPARSALAAGSCCKPTAPATPAPPCARMCSAAGSPTQSESGLVLLV